VLAAEKGAHIATVFLVEAVKASTKRGIEIISWSAVAVMYAVLVRATWNMLEIVHDERTPILLVPTSVTYGCLMAGMLMLALLALLSAYRALRGVQVARDDSEPGAQAAQG
jgi:TRAP-type C4-dicarboxylate transport system permease small subunit